MISDSYDIQIMPDDLRQAGLEKVLIPKRDKNLLLYLDDGSKIASSFDRKDLQKTIKTLEKLLTNHGTFDLIIIKKLACT